VHRYILKLKEGQTCFFFRFNDWWLKDIFIIEVVNHHCCDPLILESLKAGTKAGGEFSLSLMKNSILLCYAILFYLSIIEMNLRTDVLSQREIPIKKASQS